MILNTSSVKVALEQAISQLQTNYPNIELLDLSIQIDEKERTFLICDDEDHQLFVASIDQSIPDDKLITPEVVQNIKQAVKELHQLKRFNELNLLSPFSIILVDRSYSIIEELLTIDESLIIIDEDWEKVLEEFLRDDQE